MQRLRYRWERMTALTALLLLLPAVCACTVKDIGLPQEPATPAVTQRPETFVFEVSPQGEPAAEAQTTPAPLPTQTPTPAPTAAPTPVATPGPADALRPAENVYTIAWLSDTQHYSKKFPASFAAQTEYLAANEAWLHLKYIVFTGDFVHNRDDEEQWKTASEAMSVIEHIPNGVLAGNHDVDVTDSNNDYTMFKKYFGAKRYQDKPWYGGSFDNNRGHFDLIDAGETRYVFVYLGYNVDKDGIAWVNATLGKYRDRVGILCVHGYFDSDLSLLPQGEQLYNKVVAKNPNLYMVLCGHRYNCACVPAAFDDDGDGIKERTVYQMIQNYQAAGAEGGDGYLRLLEVDEEAGVIRHFSYSPLVDDCVYFDTEEHRAEKHSFSPDGEQGELPIPWIIKEK